MVGSNSTPTMKREYPEEVSNLLEYQLNAADVLHEAFYETEEQKEALHNDLVQGTGGKEHENYSNLYRKGKTFTESL